MSPPRLSPRLLYFYLLLALAAKSQDSATLQGFVRDSKGYPVSQATVYLQAKSAQPALTAQTDLAGSYRFTGLAAGAYLLRVQASGSGEAPARPFTLGERETKKLDLTVEDAFFDEPNFIVAGVTDAMSHGGHGSDTVLRSTEELARETAALSEPSAAEKRGDALQAAQEYQRAAELDATEPHLFDWGTDLLMHRAAGQAAEVFAKGCRLFPRSQRMLLGLAASWYARGNYDQAAPRFFEACDLNPGDPRPYMFLGKVQGSEVAKLPGYVARMERFAKLYPHNAWAAYYYAVSLLKQRKGPEDTEAPSRVHELLQKAVRLDPNLGAAYLQLGILYSGQHDDTRAIAAYQKAVAVSPLLDEPHYRLAQSYGRTAQKEKARHELDIYDQMSRKSQQEIERERSEIRQFVFELRDTGRPAPAR